MEYSDTQSCAYVWILVRGEEDRRESEQASEREIKRERWSERERRGEHGVDHWGMFDTILCLYSDRTRVSVHTCLFISKALCRASLSEYTTHRTVTHARF